MYTPFGIFMRLSESRIKRPKDDLRCAYILLNYYKETTKTIIATIMKGNPNRITNFPLVIRMIYITSSSKSFYFISFSAHSFRKGEGGLTPKSLFFRIELMYCL